MDSARPRHGVKYPVLVGDTVTRSRPLSSSSRPQFFTVKYVHKPERVNEKQPGTLSVVGNRATIALASSDGGSVVFEGADAAASGTGAGGGVGGGVGGGGAKAKAADGGAASPGFLLIFRAGRWHLERVAAAYSVRSNTTRETPPALPDEWVPPRSPPTLPRGRGDGFGFGGGGRRPTSLVAPDDGAQEEDEGGGGGMRADVESAHDEGDEPWQVSRDSSSPPPPSYAAPPSRRPPPPRPAAKARLELVEPDVDASAGSPPPSKRPRRELQGGGTASPPGGGVAAMDMGGGGGGGSGGGGGGGGGVGSLGRSASAGKAPMRAAPASPDSSGGAGDSGSGSGSGSASRWPPVASKGVAQKGVASKTVALKGVPGGQRRGEGGTGAASPSRAAKKVAGGGVVGGGSSSRRRSAGSDDEEDDESSHSSDSESVSGSSLGSSDGSYTDASTE
ncbi:hypothetical protein MMPV_007101 [Pyropia vietnamensis]